MASEVDFLVGEPIVDVDDDQCLVFVRGPDPAPSLYAGVGRCLVVAADGVESAAEGPDASLRGKVVARTSTDGGVLVLGFTDRSELRCAPDEDFEAWEVVGGTPQGLVVCLPGGELCVFDERTPPVDLGTFLAERSGSPEVEALRKLLSPHHRDDVPAEE